MSRRVVLVSLFSVFLFVLLAGVKFSAVKTRAASPTESERKLSSFLLPEDRFNLPVRFRAAREDADEFALEASREASRFQPNQTDDDGPRTPKIDRVRPREVVANGPEFRLRITGEDFRNGSRVTLNGTPYKTFFVNNRNLFVNVPVELTRTPGNIAVTVIDPRDKPVNTVNMTVLPESNAITIAGLQPTIVVEGQSDFAIRIFGTGFRPAGRTVDPVIRVGGERVDYEFRRSGEFNEIIAAVSVRDVGVSGTVPIQVELGEQLSKVFNLIISAPGPSIESLTPGRADVGSKDTKVTVAGQNFNEDSRVIVNGTPVPTKFNSFIELEATVPEALLTTIGQLEVVVDNPGESASDTRLFSVIGADPIIFSISPTRVAAGDGNFTLTITGANLNEKDTKVLVAGQSVEFTDPTGREISVSASRDFIRNTGRVPIKVQTGGKESNTLELIVEAPSTVSTVSGRSPGYRDGTAAQALFARPSRAAVGPDGLIYVADQLNHVIRTVDPRTGEVKTFAGDGFEGYVDTLDIDLADTDKDNDAVRFSNPLGVAVDRDGTVYVSDYGNDVIRRIRRASGGRLDVDTYAGQNRKVFNEEIGKRERIGQPGYQDGPVVSARFSGPDGIKIGPDGKLYVADAFNNVVRVITPSPEGIRGTVVSTLFGNLNPGNVDGVAPNVRFSTPLGLDFLGRTLMVADFANNRIRAIDLDAPQLVARTLTGIAGNGDADGTRQVAKLNGPLAVTVLGNQVFVVDNGGNRIRRVESTGEVSTVAGNVADFVDGPGPRARFRAPRDIIRISDAELIVVDQGNNRIRKITR